MGLFKHGVLLSSKEQEAELFWLNSHQWDPFSNRLGRRVSE